MKKSISLISFLIIGFLVFPNLASMQVTGSLWKLSANSLLPVNSSWGVTIPSLANLTCIGTNSSGVFGAGTCGGGGTPGGSNLQLQYNNSGSFGGISGAISNGTSLQLTSGDFLLEGASSGGVTLNAPATGGGVLTLPPGTDTIAGLAATQALTNKSVNGVTLTAAGSATTYLDGTGNYSTPPRNAYDFPLAGNATSTLTQFNGGITAYATSTIGAGGQTTGLTISGGATTTLTSFLSGNVGIGKQPTANALDVNGTINAGVIQSPIYRDGTGNNVLLAQSTAFARFGNTNLARLNFGGDTNASVALQRNNVGSNGTSLSVELGDGSLGGMFGVGTTSPYAKLSVHADNGETNSILFAIASSTQSATTTLFTVGNTGSTTISLLGACSGTSALNTTVAGLITCGTVTSTGSAYPFTPSTDGGINTSATSTPIQGTNPGLGLDVSNTSWYGIGGQLLAYASTTNGDTIFGINAGGNVSTTSATSASNSLFGYQAGQKITSGSNDVLIGASTGLQLTSGAQNTFVGGSIDAGNNGDHAGNNNSIFGFQAGNLLGASAIENAALGAGALGNNVSGTDNIALGYDSGSNITGSFNVNIGSWVNAPVAANTGQLNIGNVLYGTNLYSTGNVLSSYPTVNGNIGIGSTTPFAKFSIHGNFGDTNSLLFDIASSSQGATSTLFSVNNIGSTSISLLGVCNGTNALNTTATGLITCGVVTSTGGAAYPFTPSTFGIAVSATSTPILDNAGLIAATSTFGTIVATSSVTITNLGIAAGQFAAFNAIGQLIGTTTPINTGGSTEGVNWATTGVLAGTPTYSNGTLGVGATLTEIGTGALSVDSNSPAANDRVLVKNQASAFQNGIYVVTATGSGIASYILTRSTDYNSNTEITPGLTTYVVSGTANLDTTWAVNFTVPLTMGTTNLNYTLAAGTGSAISSLGPLGQLQTGATQTLATSSDTNLGLTITASGNVQTFTTNWLGTLSTTRGGLGGNFNASTGALSINSGTVSAGTLSIANGGTNATSFTTTGNGVYWNGTSLLTAPLTSAVTYPFASTTALTASGELVIPNGATKGSTVAGQLELDTTNDQLKVGDGAAIAVFDQRRFLTFTYATTTAWAGTTTLLSLGTAPTGLTLQNVQCYTDVGTLNVQYQYGTGPTLPAMLNASTTIGTFTWTGNNAPAAGNTIGVKVGTPASSPTQISCTITAVVVGT